MKTWHVIVLAVAIIIAGLLNGGIYHITSITGSNEMGEAYKINRFTGRTWVLYANQAESFEVHEHE